MPTDFSPLPDALTKVKHVIHFSGGLCSFFAALRAIRRYGIENVILVFADTKMEDDELYRFLVEALAYLFYAPALRDELPLNIPSIEDAEKRSAYLADLGARLTAAVTQFVYLADGRNPWQLFRDEKRIGSGRADICSRVLKRELLDKWRKENMTPSTSRFYLGMDWTEGHRMDGKWTTKKGKRVWQPGMIEIFAPFHVSAPMMEEPIWDKCRMQRELALIGIKLPSLYSEGFPHNNCGGFCVKAGMAHFAHLLKTRPWVYNFHERQEEETRVLVGDYSVMKDRRGGGPRRTLTMRQFRERVEAGEDFDRDDWGGCGCSVDFQPDEDEDAA